MATVEAIREIVREGMSSPIPKFVPRSVALPRVPNRATVIMGVRRAGKTYRLYQHAQELMEAGVPRERLLFVDFEDDRLFPVDSHVISHVVEAYLQELAARGEDPSHVAYLFFDEVQAIPEWGRQIRRLLRSQQFEIFVTGSSAKMLSTEIATEFAGRSIAMEVFPLSFGEYLRFHDLAAACEMPEITQRPLLASAFERYLAVGGFPEVQMLDEAPRIALLQNLVEVVIARDICLRHNLAPQGAEAFIKLAVRTSGREFSVAKTFATLKSTQIPLARDMAYALSAYGEDAYLFFVISQFSRSLRTQTAGTRKLYAVDHGLQFALSPSPATDLGQRLECAVFLQLRRKLFGRREGAVAIYRTKDGREVDFVVGDKATSLSTRLLQVSVDISDPKTAQREYGALTQALNETKIDHGEVVVLDASRCVPPEDERIELISAWRWFLQEEGCLPCPSTRSFV